VRAVIFRRRLGTEARVALNRKRPDGRPRSPRFSCSTLDKLPHLPIFFFHLPSNSYLVPHTQQRQAGKSTGAHIERDEDLSIRTYTVGPRASRSMHSVTVARAAAVLSHRLSALHRWSPTCRCHEQTAQYGGVYPALTRYHRNVSILIVSYMERAPSQAEERLLIGHFEKIPWIAKAQESGPAPAMSSCCMRPKR